jgi:biotin-(acetyl-CoA carboxylase) ligase
LKFIKEYEKIWLHTGEEVSIIHETSGPEEKVVIKGLDSDGYLEVRSKETGKLFSVSDDGNTFDRLKGLIRPKQ